MLVIELKFFDSQYIKLCDDFEFYGRLRCIWTKRKEKHANQIVFVDKILKDFIVCCFHFCFMQNFIINVCIIQTSCYFSLLIVKTVHEGWFIITCMCYARMDNCFLDRLMLCVSVCIVLTSIKCRAFHIPCFVIHAHVGLPHSLNYHVGAHMDILYRYSGLQ